MSDRRSSSVGFLEGRFAIVTREWFDKAIAVMNGEHGCPFCGSKREPYRSENAGMIRVGCSDCNRWFS